MKIDFLAKAKEYSEEICAVRRSIHSQPELGNNEYNTADKIEEFLKGCLIQTERLTATSVMGILYGREQGRTVAFRADIDALPITEKTGVSFASENDGVMHACGHDVHTSALLGAARLLSGVRDSLKGNVVFLFEPDEEGCGGARRMIDAGALNNVDAVFGAHVSPDLPSGQVGVRFGKFYAASDMFTIKVYGKGSHGAEPEKGIDALAAGAKLALQLKQIPEKYTEDKCVVSVGTFNSGTAGNIISDYAELSGIIRTLGKENRTAVKNDLKEAVEAVAREIGVRTEILIRESYGGVVNHDEETALVADTVREYLGEASLTVIDKPTMTTEDFGCFLEETKGSFYHIGAGCCAPLHSPEFLPDENSLLTAAAVHSAVAWEYLNK